MDGSVQQIECRMLRQHKSRNSRPNDWCALKTRAIISIPLLYLSSIYPKTIINLFVTTTVQLLNMSASLRAVQRLAARTEAAAKAAQDLQRFDRRGVVVAIQDGRLEVKTALGNTVFTPIQGNITNGAVIGGRVLVTRPVLGRAFVDAEVRG